MVYRATLERNSTKQKKKKGVNNRGISRDFLQKFCYIFSEFYMLA